jgi:alpha/beta hydrolase fold
LVRIELSTEEELAAVARLYLGDHDRCDPLASPLYGDLAGLPPVRIHVGEDEILLDDSVRFGERLEAAGGVCQVHTWQGMIHVFPIHFALLTAAKKRWTTSATSCEGSCGVKVRSTKDKALHWDGHVPAAADARVASVTGGGPWSTTRTGATGGGDWSKEELFGSVAPEQLVPDKRCAAESEIRAGPDWRSRCDMTCDPTPAALCAV